MNPQSQRDSSIERLLRESLATSPTTPETGSCLDAEMLAAWVDGGLVGGQLVAAQEHVAGCSTCQATLAALVRTTPTEFVVEPWWRRALSARWLVPVAATATALAIWVVVPRERVHAAAGASADGRRSDRWSPQGTIGSSFGVIGDASGSPQERSRCRWRFGVIQPRTATGRARSAEGRDGRLHGRTAGCCATGTPTACS